MLYSIILLLAVSWIGVWTIEYPQGHDVSFYFWSCSINGRLANGRCCDTSYNVTDCPGDCDVNFFVCIREHNETSKYCNSSTSSHINIFRYIYLYVKNITFFEGDNVFGRGLHNPLVYSFYGNWSKQVQTVLAVRDFDLSGDNYFTLIDYIDVNWTRSAGEDIERRNYAGAYKNMIVHVGLKIDCWEAWYGEYCNVYCVRRDDSEGHYECDTNGDKLCLEGWTGVHCLTRICYPACPMGASCNTSTRVCECNNGYKEVGELCKCIPHSECNLIGGRCQLPGECNCLTGYSGNNCDTTDYCLVKGNPCTNEGVCVPTGNYTYICECSSGYQGDHCDFMACPNTGCGASLPCGNNGMCSNITTGVHCMCDSGYIGRCCDTLINYCLENPCPHGVCQNMIGDYVCTCDAGYSGKDCDMPIDECGIYERCSNGVCIDIIAGYLCDCDTGYHGVNCTDMCSNTSLCDWYTGENCETNIDDCMGACANGATCTDGIDSHHCHCISGYTGISCADDVDECYLYNRCIHGACNNNIGSYTCNCINGYTGQYCDTFIQLDYCSMNNLCVNGGACLNDHFTTRCECNGGYSGTYCEVEPDPCLDIICYNEGVCKAGLCECSVSYTNPECSQLVDVCEELVSPADCNGECVNDVTLSEGYICDCYPGYTGPTCHIDIDDCITGECLNQGICTDGLNEYFCECQYGYAGDRCEEVLNTCETNNCLNGAVCLIDGADSVCQCQEGYITPICQKIENCDRKSCSNKGECKEMSEDLREAVCLCDGGYTGKYCDSIIDYCIPDPCDVGAICYSGINSYYCKCDNNVSGCVESGDPGWQLIEGIDNSVAGLAGGLVLGVTLTLLSVLILVLIILIVRYKRKRRQPVERENTGDTFINPFFDGTAIYPLIDPPSYDTVQVPHYLIKPAVPAGEEKNETFENYTYKPKIPL
ncbi:Protein jagged-1a-like [Oopsacas minuta]|uniref:Delta-like protein n=1 Tax=Oopsacas minuta TaxID=111878 RepID=A0AAV7JJG9_9METZ|nr:Protein jagged-1a-like [Oopsacas minuta]